MSSPVQQQAKRERGGAGQERAGGASTGCCFGRHVDGAMGLRVYKGRAPWWCYSPILEQRVPGWSSGHWTLQVAATVISDPRFGWGDIAAVTAVFGLLGGIPRSQGRDY